MSSKPPRLRRQLATNDPQPAGSSGSKIGPLPVSALAGLIAAAFALFVLGTWLTVHFIRRRKKSRNRRTGASHGQKASVADEEADSKQKIPDNTDQTERHSSSRNIKSTTPYLPGGLQAAEDFKYDP